MPILYEVDRSRDGNSFTARRVVAIQHGKQIFNLAASFQMPEAGYEHQFAMPNVPPPEELEDETEARWRKRRSIAGMLARMADAAAAVRNAPGDPGSARRPAAAAAFRQYLVSRRRPGARRHPPSADLAGLCLRHDVAFDTSLLPHGKSIFSSVQVASLDHAMWFHRPFRFDDWLLYAQDSPSASGARGFNRGAIFTRDGSLIASVAQEGLIRPRGA